MQRWRLVGLRGRLHLGIGACIAILLMLSSLPAQAADATAIYTNADGITINDSGPATPYASEIEVSGMNYPIIDVNVTLTRIHHTVREYDVYVVLVGPQGQSVFLIRNNGIYQDVDATMGFDDQAADPMAARDETFWYQGTYRPAPDFTSDPCPGVDPLPDPAPSEPSSEGLSIFNGTNPNGTWRLFVGDACQGGDGSIESWSLEITTPAVKAPTVNTNSAGITINSSGAADPYPSEIDVAGMSGVVTDVNVTLSGFSHDYPSEVRVLLVSPTGGSTFLLRENGTEHWISNITLTLDEQAARAIPPLGIDTRGDERLQSGIFRPTPYLTSRSCRNIVPLPPPAPSESLDGTLSVFNGANPNGTWQLFVGDDCGGNGGSIASWSLEITTTAPVVTVPDNIVVDNDPGLAGAVVSFTATATDVMRDDLTPTCTMPSGSLFPLGETTVTCQATDGEQLTESASFTVTVNDVEPPVIGVPADISIPDDGSGGVVVDFIVTATDNSGRVASLGCVPQSGSYFPIGTTTVTCYATDPSANEASETIDVTVTDVEAPVITVPADISAADDGSGGVVVDYSVSATDNSGTVSMLACVPPSGSYFSLGETTVTCEATDGDGNTASDSFTVTVNDVAAPVITTPADISAEDDGYGGVVVDYTVTATDNSGAVATLTCLPPSGSYFPIGTTTVTCIATDTSANEATETFDVTVRGGDVLAILRADTIARVDNRMAERSLVAMLDQARQMLDRGYTTSARMLLRWYDVQLQIWERFRLIPSSVAVDLHNQVHEVIVSMT